MHIGFLTSEYPLISSSSGGLGTSIKNLSTSLISNGIKVSVFIYSQSENKRFEKDGISFHLIKHKRYRFGGWYFYRKKIQNYLNKNVIKEEIDLLEAPDWTGITAFMNIICPVVIRLNGSDGYFCYLEKRNQKYKNYQLERIALKGADHIVSVSAFTAEITRKIFDLKLSIPIIPNGIDEKEFSPCQIKINKGQILYFGTIIRKKGVLELAFIFNEIIKKNPECTLLMVGRDVVDVVEKKSTYNIFSTLLDPIAAKKVNYISEVDYKEVKKYICSSEVVTLPSFAEALPMTWIEAMAMEKPLVTSDIGWAEEVMENGKTGFTENPKNHKAFAEKILCLLMDTDLSQKMGINARTRVKTTFSSGIVAKKNLVYYKEIVDNFS